MPAPASSPNRWRWIGLVGSVLLAAGAAGAGVLPRPDELSAFPPLRLMRSGAGPEICIGVAAVGMALLVFAWWRLRDAAELTGRWVLTTAAWWSAPLLLAPPLFSRDVYSYAAVGDLLRHGFDPYEVGPAVLPSPWLESVSITWVTTPAPYGPLYLQLAHLAVALSGYVIHAAILLLRVIAVAGVLLTAVYLPRLASACGVDPQRALWLAVASPLVLAHYVSGAHNDAVMVGLLVAGLAYAAERRPVVAAIFLALAAAVKAPALIVLPFAALLWSTRLPGRWAVARAGALSALVAGAAFGAVTAVTGLGLGWIDAAAGTPGITVQWTSIPTGFGLAAGWVASAMGHPGAADTCLAVARTIGTGVLLGVLVALFAHAWRRRHDVRLVIAAAGWSLLAAVLLAPAFHPWYFPWALAPLAASVTDRRVVTGLSIAVAALCFLVLPDGFSLARLTVVPGVIFDIVGTAVLVAAGVRRLRSSRPAPAPEPGEVVRTG